jgi:SAM-dependent methyltransferase
VSTTFNLFTSTAELYDLDVRGMGKVDVDFYLDYARRLGSPILELACGTGRVTIPVARAGFDVVGVDLSTSMLKVFNAKIEALDPKTRRRIRVVRDDMAAFALRRKFPLIIIPFRGFQALTDYDAARSCLLQVRHHLAEGGHFVFDVFRTSGKLDRSWIGSEYIDWVHRDPDSGRTIRRKGHHRDIDPKAQVIYPDVIYEIQEPGGHTRRLVDHLSLKYWYQYQLEVLLITTGFSIQNVFGYYNRAPAGSGPELIFDCTAP